MPAGRQEARTAALALAVALHVLVLLLALQLRARPERPEATEDPVMMAIRIPEERAPEERRPTPETERTPRRVAPRVQQPDEPRTESITLPPEATPRIDWYREAEITVQSMGGAIGQKQPSLQSEPEVMTLPEREQGPKVGDAWLLPNGITVVQVSKNVTCESGPQFVGDVFEIWARTAPVRCSYKGKPKPELDLKRHEPSRDGEIELP